MRLFLLFLLRLTQKLESLQSTVALEQFAVFIRLGDDEGILRSGRWSRPVRAAEAERGVRRGMLMLLRQFDG